MGSLSRPVCCGSNRDAFRVDPRGLRVVRRSGHYCKIELCLLFYNWSRPWNKRSDISRCPCCSEKGLLRVRCPLKKPYKVSRLRWAERNESEKSYFPFWGVNEFLPKANRKKYCADLAVCSPLCHSPSHGHWSSDRPLRTGLALAGTNTFFTRQFEWWFLYVRYHH